jgi:hypothetical protein
VGRSGSSGEQRNGLGRVGRAWPAAPLERGGAWAGCAGRGTQSSCEVRCSALGLAVVLVLRYWSQQRGSTSDWDASFWRAGASDMGGEAPARLRLLLSSHRGHRYPASRRNPRRTPPKRSAERDAGRGTGPGPDEAGPRFPPTPSSSARSGDNTSAALPAIRERGQVGGGARHRVVCLRFAMALIAERAQNNPTRRYGPAQSLRHSFFVSPGCMHLWPEAAIPARVSVTDIRNVCSLLSSWRQAFATSFSTSH